MDVLATIAQVFLEQGVPTWALLLVSIFAFIYILYAKRSANSNVIRAQLDSQYQRFVDDIQEQLARERKFGVDAAHRVDKLSEDLAYLRGQNQVLGTHIRMFVACDKQDCPFRDVRKTLA